MSQLENSPAAPLFFTKIFHEIRNSFLF